jgi:hypothetical protein
LKYGDISPAVATYSVSRMLADARTKLTLEAFAKAGPLQPTYTAIDVPCSVCEAAAGVPCRAVRRHFNWIVDKHAERVEDARLVTEAVRALTPAPGLRNGDTVTFHGNRLVVR